MRPEYAALLARERVNVRNGVEVELWTEVLDIYVADVIAAIAEVGTESARVLDYLVARGMVGQRSRTPEPVPKSMRRGVEGES